MTGAMIVQLLIAFGPTAVEWISKLIDNWSHDMTPDEVRAILALASKSYDQYIAEAKAKLPPTP